MVEFSERIRKTLDRIKERKVIEGPKAIPLSEIVEKGAYAEPVDVNTKLINGKVVHFVIGVPIERPFRPNVSTLDIHNNTPYVYKVETMQIFDPSEEKIVLGKPFKPKLKGVAKDVIVMDAHGFRSYTDDQWRFGDGQKVKDVVEGYMDFAKKNGLPALEFITACNREVVPDAVGLGIIVQDLPMEYGIVQQANDIMALPGKKNTPISSSGFPFMRVHPMRGFLWGIDEFLIRKESQGKGKKFI
jgi:hypothetical protein